MRENVRDNEVEVVKIGTKEKLADPLTKALPVACFVEQVKRMRLMSSINT